MYDRAFSTRAFFLSFFSILILVAFADPVMAQTGPVANAGRDRTVSFDGVNPVTVVLDGTATTDGSGDQLTDNDPATPYGITWSILSTPSGSAAALSDDQAIRPTFVIDQPGDYVIQLVANDGTDISTDTVTISTVNSAPAADAGRDRKVALNDVVVLDGSGSTDWDGDAITYSWTVTAPDASPVTLSDPNAVMPSFTVLQSGDYTATLTVSDGTHTSDAAQAIISTVNVPPTAIANAGQDKVIPAGLSTHKLDAEGTSDLDNTGLNYRWSLLWGPPAGGYSFADETTRRATMATTNAAGDWVVQLTVDDGAYMRSTTMLLSAGGNLPPKADAGADQAATAGQSVTLDGIRSSDVNGDAITYRWALIHKPVGSAAALDDPSSIRPRFNADVAGTYVAQLIVNDGTTDSTPDTVVISTSENLAPVANAGTDYFQQGSGSTIQLDGTGSSDANGDALTYSWTMLEVPTRSSAAISNPASPTPTFDTDKNGIYVVQLVVSDGTTESAPDIVMISKQGQGATADVNLRPIAEGGTAVFQTAGALVQLDGSGSVNPNDPNPLNMTYKWALIHKPAGSTATLSDPTAVNPTFTTDVAGLYVAQLMVFDSVFYSLPDAAETRLNAAPVAAAGPDQNGYVDQAVMLDGSASSDADNDPLTYAWSFVSKPTGSLAVLSGPTTATPGFTPDVYGDYSIQLIVNDGHVNSVPDLVTVSMVNRTPVAEAGTDQSVTAGALVQLDGSGSSDIDHQALTYSWRFTAKPTGSLATLSDPSIVNPTFTADVEGLYVAELVVNDGVTDSAPDIVGIRVGSGIVNTAPVLDPVGPQTVELGSVLNLTLTASDADGDPFSFFATPLPLASGASFDAATGVFTYRPTAGQVGTYNITFGVSDGLASDSESVQITINAPPAGTLTTLTGTLLDAVSQSGGQTVPVSGATVTLVGSGISTTTDAQGIFTLTSVPSGDQLLSVDGSTAAVAPDGSAYGSVRQDVTLIADAVNTLDDAVYLPRVDPNGTATYASTDTNPTTITNTSLGVTLTVAAQSATLSGSAYDGPISVSDMPPAEAAAMLPSWVSPCQLISIQPFNLRFSGSVVLPNPDNLAAGAQVDIWGMHPDTGAFLVMATGTVSADGSQIVQTSGNIWAATLLMALPRLPNVALAEDMNNDNLNPSLLGTGNVSQSISLPGYTSLSEKHAISLVYDSQAADARPIVAANTTFVAGQALPPKISGTLEIGGVAVAGPVYMDTAIAEDAVNAPGISTGQAIRQALQFDAGEMPSGAFEYSYVTTAKYNCSTVSRAAHGRAIVNNQKGSALGAGWTIPGVERLDVQADGSALITEGDGTAKVFDVNPTGQFFPPVGVPVGWPGAAALDDLDGDGNLDIAVPGMTGGNIVLLFGDGNGKFPIDRRFTAGQPRNSQFFPDTHTIATGDFNGDGIRDLVVNNQLSNKVRVYLGTGGGLFGNPIDLTVNLAQGLSVADIDLDGNDDIVVASSGLTHKVFVFFGNGAGAFPASASVATAAQNVGVEIADFDNDGLPDVAVASAGSDKVYVLHNGGARNFTTVTGTSAGPIRWLLGRYSMAVSDFNGDGNQDIAVGNEGLSTLQVLFGNGIGGFSPSQGTVNTGGEAVSVRAADIDLDGKTDIVFSRNDGTLGVALGDGTGLFQTASDIPVSFGAMFGMTVGDFNHDGAPDIQTGSGGEDKLFTLMADPSNGSLFRSPGADFTTLTKNPDGTWVRRMTDGTTVEYNADGLMTARVDANGNRTEYTYTGGLLSSISDPSDPTRSTSFDYSGGTLSSITEVSGRSTYFQVDADGNLVKMTDAGGNEWRYAYDAESKLSAFSTARGFVTSFDYGFAGQYLGTNNPDGTSVTASIAGDLGLTDYQSAFGTETTPEPSVAPADRIATLTDARNNTYTMEVNEYGALIRVTDPIGRTTRFIRDANNLVRQSIRDNDGLLPDGTAPATVTTNLDYDERGNTIAKTEAAGTTLERTTRFEYEPTFNKLIKVVDPSNTGPAPTCATAGVTCMDYDPLDGDLLKVTDAKGGEQNYTYDPRGLRLTATDQDGNVTTFTYDFYGNIETSTDGAGDVTKMIRNAAGEAMGVTEGYGTAVARTTSYVFDDLGRITFETDPEGGVKETRYDADGNVIAAIDQTGIASTKTYDEMDRLETESHPATGTVTRVYDENGNMKTMIDPTGKIAHFQYDAVNRADRTEDPLGGIRQFTYNLQDKPTLVVDANTNATTFKYDVFGRKVERKDAPGDTWTFAYDSRDNMVQTVDAKGQTINKTYDELSRMTGIQLVEDDGLTVEDTVTFTYDALGMKKTATDGDSSLAWSYDGANRVAKAETVAAPGTVQPAVVLTHSYDAVGNRTGLAYGPDAVTVDGTWGYQHDGKGMLTRVTLPTTETVDLAYDAASRLDRITSANTVETQVLYESATGRPSTITMSIGQAQLQQFAYGFGTDGKILSVTDSGGTRNFTYDDTLQLTGAGYASAPESYSYDAEGNRTSSHLSASYVHDMANRLRETDEACYDYDANGNLISKTLRVGLECTGDVTTYEWDVLNRLVRIDNPDGTYSTYRYDAQGRRIQKDANGSLTRYVYNDDAILLEFDGTDALLASYSHGEEVDQPLAMTRGGTSSYFYHVDHLGSVRLLSDATGAVANRYDYDAFGNLEATSYETVANPYGFTARERDAESGLMFYRARYYDPEIGRFISEDPIGFEGADLNLYRYVYNESVLSVDPSGQLIEYGITVSRSTRAQMYAGLIRGALRVLAEREKKSLLLSLAVNSLDVIKQCVIGILGSLGAKTGQEPSAKSIYGFLAWALCYAFPKHQ